MAASTKQLLMVPAKAKTIATVITGTADSNKTGDKNPTVISDELGTTGHDQTTVANTVYNNH